MPPRPIAYQPAADEGRRQNAIRDAGNDGKPDAPFVAAVVEDGATERDRLSTVQDRDHLPFANESEDQPILVFARGGTFGQEMAPDMGDRRGCRVHQNCTGDLITVQPSSASLPPRDLWPMARSGAAGFWRPATTP